MPADDHSAGETSFLGVSVRVSRGEISMRTSTLSKEDGPTCAGGHHPVHLGLSRTRGRVRPNLLAAWNRGNFNLINASTKTPQLNYN